MTIEEHRRGQSLLWQGRTTAIERLRELLAPCVPDGVLRVVVQRLTLREQSGPAGEHEVISSVVDVDGNLVAVPLRETVRNDPDRASALDETMTMLHRDLESDGLTEVDGIEVVLDSDGNDRVWIAPELEVSPQDAAGDIPHGAIHDGDHHIAHHAPALEEMRDRLTAASTSPLRRAWGALKALLRR